MSCHHQSNQSNFTRRSNRRLMKRLKGLHVGTFKQMCCERNHQWDNDEEVQG